MTFGAGRRAIGFGKLGAVNIGMAAFTGSGRGFEVGVNQRGLQIGWLVAINTGHGAMGPKQWERGLGMVEAREFLPGFGGMARFATCRCTVGARLLHALPELTLVRIRVAGGAGKIFKAVEGGVLCCRRRSLLMALSAGNGDMASGQDETSLPVLGQGEGGGPVAIQGVALLTAVQIRRRCELSLVFVFVAVEATGKLDLIKRFFPFGDMALRTGHAGVFGLERVSRGRVLFDPELCGLESFHGVAGRALSTVGTLEELAAVLIVVAIHAALESQRLLEIAAAVTLQAIHALMFAQQRVLGFGVIEALVEGGGCDPFPAGGVVARLTALLGERSVMRIGVAVGALGKG